MPNEDVLRHHQPDYIRRIQAKSRDSDEPLEALEELQIALEPVREYIHRTWRKLVRSHQDLYCGALDDPKVPRADKGKLPLYISAKADQAEIERQLRQARANVVDRIARGQITQLRENELPEIEIRRLPDPSIPLKLKDNEHGLMYLPHPYVVPGPRFNEMYNWDTAFVVRGLLQDEKFDLAKAFVENMFYQIEHYGTILNGNRTYYYNGDKSRSQPPLLTGKILGVYNNFHRLRLHQEYSKTQWLKRAVSYAERYYQHWITPPHLHAESGLSRYSSTMGVPAFEVIHSEKQHYDKALGLLEAMHNKQRLMGEGERIIPTLDYQDRKDRYYLEQYYTPAKDGQPHRLSADFYRGDRAMRETGFDPSRRFGFFNVDVINYLPVCLNALRHRLEREMGNMYQELALQEPDGCHKDGRSWYELAKEWEARAGATAEAVNHWLWDAGERDEGGRWLRKPCYHDFNLNAKLCEKYQLPRFRDYDFVTSFYPLWAGIASREQADLVVEHLLPRLKTKWGILTSSRQTGSQWDKPFMWAPLVVVAVEALEKYDYYEQALDIASGFLRMIVRDFAATGKLYEKYNALTGSSDVSDLIEMGYSENVEGFAWTNSVILELSHALERLQRKCAGLPLEAPDILTQLTVVEHGRVRPQYEA